MNPLALLVLGVGISLLGRSPSPSPSQSRSPSVGGLQHTSLTPPGARDEAPARPVRPTWVLPMIVAVAVVVLSFALIGLPGAVIGLLVGLLAARWVSRRALTNPAADARARLAIPLVLDLMAAALRTGVPTATALAAVAGAAPIGLRRDLIRTAALLQLGASPREAWAVLGKHPVLGPLAAVATRSADSGIRLAEGLERQALELRAQLRSTGIARANRVATLSLLPLGLCFLPAFICLGVVPIVVGVAGDAFGSISP